MGMGIGTWCSSVKNKKSSRRRLEHKARTWKRVILALLFDSGFRNIFVYKSRNKLYAIQLWHIPRVAYSSCSVCKGVLVLTSFRLSSVGSYDIYWYPYPLSHIYILLWYFRQSSSNRATCISYKRRRGWWRQQRRRLLLPHQTFNSWKCTDSFLISLYVSAIGKSISLERHLLH